MLYSKADVAIFREINISTGFIYVFKQSDPAQFETKTPAYELLNLKAGVHFPISSLKAVFSVHVKNLLDKAYYDHLSTLKDIGYYNMGRNITLNLILFFT
jgi:iron complex outermembrane receptor protein